MSSDTYYIIMELGQGTADTLFTYKIFRSKESSLEWLSTPLGFALTWFNVEILKHLDIRLTKSLDYSGADDNVYDLEIHHTLKEEIYFSKELILYKMDLH